jgi:phage protein D
MEQLVLEDHVDMTSYLAVRIGGTEGQPDWKVEIGQTVKVKLGEGGVLLFTGDVTAVEPSWTGEGITTLTVRALDQTHRLARGRKTRWFENKKDSDVAQTVGKDCGLSLEVEGTTEVHPYILQRNESDLAFLKRLAARNNYQVAVTEGKLIFRPAKTSGDGVTLTMGSNIRSVRMQMNSQDMVSKVVVRGWDPREKKEIVGTATTGDIEAIGKGEKGADIAKSKFGETTAYITDVPVATQAQANELAKSEMNRLARQFVHGTGVANGNDKLRAGTIVTFEGLPGGHKGGFYIVSSRHVITPTNGYVTEFAFCSNTMGKD